MIDFTTWNGMFLNDFPSSFRPFDLSVIIFAEHFFPKGGISYILRDWSIIITLIIKLTPKSQQDEITTYFGTHCVTFSAISAQFIHIEMLFRYKFLQ